MKLNLRSNRLFFIDIFKTIVIPIFAGICFIGWLLYLFQYPIIAFPAIFIVFVIMYLVSGYIFGGIFLAFVASAGIFTIASTTGLENKFLLITEIVWIIILFIRIEHYRALWIADRIKLKNQHEVLDRDITLIKSSIEIAEKKSSALKEKMQNFQTLEQIIKTLENITDEKKLVKQIEFLTQKFIAKGKFVLRRNPAKDVFVNYIKQSKLPLLITNAEEDKRFADVDYGEIVSLIAIPIEVEGKYWGTIKGVSANKNEIFNDYDLRLLSILSNLLGFVLNNAILFKKVKSLAITDGLTGLYTRSFFVERLQEEMQRAKSNDIPICVAIIDIDFFKKVNDTYGHLAGDNLLRQLANMLRKRFRSLDIVARYGGEEFVILMYHTVIKDAYKILDEFRVMIEQEKFFMSIESYQPIQIRKTISIGITEFDNEQTTEEIIKKADRALYEAKKTGRNKTCIYNKEL